MLSQQTPYTAQPIEQRPEMQPPTMQQRPVVGPEYNEQFIESLAQRLMPRLMPEILYQLRATEPMRSRNRAFGMSLALAIVSLALMIPLTAIVLNTLATAIGPALIGISVVGLVMVLINVLFNYMLFNLKS
jgi:hypothetical protein